MSPFRGRHLLLPLLLAPLACRAEPEAPLRVGGVAYASEQVARLTPEQLGSLADLTAFGLATARGELGALAEPLAERAAGRARANALPWALAARELNLGEAELRQAYAAAPDWELTVRHLVRLVPRWATPPQRQEAQARTEEARRRALAGEDFGALAGEYSEEPGAAERGGQLQPGREGTWVDPFWNAALALQPGGISPVVETEYGYHVIRLEERRAVPFEEADRATLLRRAVPEARASAAMERWMAEHLEQLRLDRTAALTARGLLAIGEAPDTLVLARWPAPLDGGEEGRYTARDLALFRASLDGEELERLDAAEESGYLGRIERDAQEAMWADAAGRLGVAPAERDAVSERRVREARTTRWAEGLGFRRGMAEEEIRTMALRALAGRGQEARITRMELVGLRPLLWERYEVSGAALPSPTASSSSPTRKSVSTA